jgi:hypothetical protein
MFEKLKFWNRQNKLPNSRGQVTEAPFPHCDQRVLHAPTQCKFCDLYPHLQELRMAWGICFTGTAATEFKADTWTNLLPCPSDYNRGLGGAHAWYGNSPKPKDKA